MTHEKITCSENIPLNILYADDDSDDHYFFGKVLDTLPFNMKLIIMDDGEKLITYLSELKGKLPDVLFLDYNMPRKNGEECLVEIMQNPRLKKIPVVIYSTYLHETVMDEFYNLGAYFCLRKTNLAELKSALQFIFTKIIENKFVRPSREQFVISDVFA